MPCRQQKPWANGSCCLTRRSLPRRSAPQRPHGASRTGRLAPSTRSRKGELDLRPALPVSDVNLATVSTHHGPDDRKPEPAAAVAAAGGGAAEALERARQELGREAGASIAHPDFDALISNAD